MRHKAHRNRLIQKPDHGRMIQRNLVTSLLMYEEIRTTRKRARVIQPIVDRLITVSKGDNAQTAIRSINAVVTDVNASRKLMEVLRERYAKRPSGFTRMKAVGARKGDGAELVDLSLVDKQTAKPVEAPKAQKKAAAKKPAAEKADEQTSSESSAS